MLTFCAFPPLSPTGGNAPHVYANHPKKVEEEMEKEEQQEKQNEEKKLVQLT